MSERCEALAVEVVVVGIVDEQVRGARVRRPRFGEGNRALLVAALHGIIGDARFAPDLVDRRIAVHPPLDDKPG